VTYQAQTRPTGKDLVQALGDRDIRTHYIFRTEPVAARRPTTEVALRTADRLRPIAHSADVRPTPCSYPGPNGGGWLDFQDYFVRLRQEPEVLEVRFDGAVDAAATPEVLDAIRSADRDR